MTLVSAHGGSAINRAIHGIFPRSLKGGTNPFVYVSIPDVHCPRLTLSRGKATINMEQTSDSCVQNVLGCAVVEELTATILR